MSKTIVYKYALDKNWQRIKNTVINNCPYCGVAIDTRLSNWDYCELLHIVLDLIGEKK